MHLINPPERDLQSPAITYRTNHLIKPQPQLQNHRSAPPEISQLTSIIDRYQPLCQNQFPPSQENAQFNASRSSLRYSESPDRFKHPNKDFVQNRECQNQGYTCPQFLEKLREKTPFQNDVQHAHESLTKQRYWIPRPSFSAIRLWNPMYEEADNRAEFYRRNAEWATRTYGRPDISEPLYIPSDELAISDADELTTECESKSLITSQVNNTESFMEKEDLHVLLQEPKRKLQKLMKTISEKSEIQKTEKFQQSEQNSKVLSSIRAMSKPSNYNSNRFQGEKTLINNLSEYNINKEESREIEFGVISSYQPSKRQTYQRLGPDFSQDDLTQIQKKSFQSNIETMTYEELSQSIVRALKSMDDAIKREVNEGNPSKSNISQRSGNKSVSSRKEQEMKRIRLFNKDCEEQKSQLLPQEYSYSQNRSELKFSSRSRSRKSIKQQKRDQSIKESQLKSCFKRCFQLQEPEEKLSQNLGKKESYNSNIYLEKQQTSNENLQQESSDEINAQEFIKHQNDSVEKEIQYPQSMNQEHQESRFIPTQVTQIRDETYVKVNLKSNSSSEDRSSGPQSSEREKYAHFMQQNSQEVSAIYPIRKKEVRRLYELENQSQYLKSNDDDLPLTFSEKKSMMRVFDDQFDTSTKHIFKEVNEFKYIGEIKELQSKVNSESYKETTKMEKIVNFAKNNLSDVSKSLQHDNQNYKTVPARNGKDESKEFQEFMEVPQFPKLSVLMRDNQMKESVMGSEDLSSNNVQMKNPSDSGHSQKNSVSKKEESEKQRQEYC